MYENIYHMYDMSTLRQPKKKDVYIYKINCWTTLANVSGLLSSLDKVQAQLELHWNK